MLPKLELSFVSDVYIHFVFKIIIIIMYED